MEQQAPETLVFYDLDAFFLNDLDKCEEDLEK